jgi:hypothetical protein
VNRIRFEGETDDGAQVRVVWDEQTPEILSMFTRGAGEHDTWSRPLELVKVDD